MTQDITVNQAVSYAMNAYNVEKLQRSNDILIKSIFGVDHCHIINDDENEQTIIAIAGTDSKYDWMLNLLFRKSSNVHMGFSIGAKLLLSIITTNGHVKKYGKQSIITYNNVYFIGHSRGGAIAEIMAELFIANVVAQNRFNVNVITFGAPRCFGLTYKINPKIKRHRFVSEFDLVPMVPFASMGFKHSVKPIIVGERRSFLSFLTLVKKAWRVIGGKERIYHLDYEKMIKNRSFELIK